MRPLTNVEETEVSDLEEILFAVYAQSKHIDPNFKNILFILNTLTIQRIVNKLGMNYEYCRSVGFWNYFLSFKDME